MPIIIPTERYIIPVTATVCPVYRHEKFGVTLSKPSRAYEETILVWAEKYPVMTVREWFVRGNRILYKSEDIKPLVLLPERADSTWGDPIGFFVSNREISLCLRHIR